MIFNDEDDMLLSKWSTPKYAGRETVKGRPYFEKTTEKYFRRASNCSQNKSAYKENQKAYTSIMLQSAVKTGTS